MLVKDHRQWQKQVKSKDKQYIEKTSCILGCYKITQSINLEYLEQEEKPRLQGSALWMWLGWFLVTLEDDRQFKVKEADLFNMKKYVVKAPKLVMSSEQGDKINWKTKKQSKKMELELTRIRKKKQLRHKTRCWRTKWTIFWSTLRMDF